MTHIGQHSPTIRAAQCSCGASYFASEAVEDFGRCESCDLFQTFSDLFKDDNGVRPSRWSNRAMREYIERRATEWEYAA